MTENIIVQINLNDAEGTFVSRKIISVPDIKNYVSGIRSDYPGDMAETYIEIRTEKNGIAHTIAVNIPLDVVIDYFCQLIDDRSEEEKAAEIEDYNRQFFNIPTCPNCGGERVQLPDDLVGFSGKETYCEGCGEKLDCENAALCKRCAA